MPDPFEGFASPASKEADPFAGVASAVDQPASTSDWQPTPYGFKVKEAVIKVNGKDTPVTMREDGAVNFPGTQDWWDGKGNRMPAGTQPGFIERRINALREEGKRQDKMPLLGQLVPGQIAGLTKGLLDTAAAPVQLAAHAVGSNVMDAPINALQQEYEQNWQTSRPSEMLGQALPLLATGGAAAPSAVQKALGFWKTVGKGALTGAVAAPVMTSETGVQGEGDYWKRKGIEAGIGGLTGGVLSGVGAGIGLAGKASAPLSPEAQAIQDLGDKFGVRVLASDMTKSPALSKAAVLAESVPGSGMVAQRQAQQAEAKAAAQKLLDQHGIQGEAGDVIQKSLQENLASTKGRVRAAYDAVGKAAEGTGPVPLDQTLEAIQAARKAEEAAVVPDQGLVGLLKKMEERLASGEVDTGYTGVRGLRSDLGSMISDYYKGTNATTGSKGVQVLQGIKGAVETDLRAFTDAQGGDIATLARKADSLYKNELVPLKDRTIVSATKHSEPDQVYKSIIAAGPDRAQKFYSAMGSNGQAAVRSEMVKNAMEAATAQDGVFSPAKFAQSLEKIQDSTGVFFKGTDKFELDGLTRLMRHVQRSGQINENPTNGQRMVTALMAGEGMGAVGSALLGKPSALLAPAVSMGSARGLTTMFSTPAGKRFLLSAANTAPGSPAMETLITKQLPRLLADMPAPAPAATLPAAAGQPDPNLAKN